MLFLINPENFTCYLFKNTISSTPSVIFFWNSPIKPSQTSSSPWQEKNQSCISDSCLVSRFDLMKPFTDIHWNLVSMSNVQGQATRVQNLPFLDFPKVKQYSNLPANHFIYPQCTGSSLQVQTCILNLTILQINSSSFKSLKGGKKGLCIFLTSYFFEFISLKVWKKPKYNLLKNKYMPCF